MYALTFYNIILIYQIIKVYLLLFIVFLINLLLITFSRIVLWLFLLIILGSYSIWLLILLENLKVFVFIELIRRTIEFYTFFLQLIIFLLKFTRLTTIIFYRKLLLPYINTFFSKNIKSVPNLFFLLCFFPFF